MKEICINWLCETYDVTRVTRESKKKLKGRKEVHENSPLLTISNLRRTNIQPERPVSYSWVGKVRWYDITHHNIL